MKDESRTWGKTSIHFVANTPEDKGLRKIGFQLRAFLAVVFSLWYVHVCPHLEMLLDDMLSDDVMEVDW